MHRSLTTFHIARRSELGAGDLAGVFRLRARIFHERLGWNVQVHDGQERDAYDELDPHYLLMKQPVDRVIGCLRLLPTQGPNMLRDVFHPLLRGKPVPADRHTWEVSRLAVESETARSHCGASGAESLERLRGAFHQLVRFADRHDIRRYVAVTTPFVQRRLEQLHVESVQLQPATAFGIDDAVVLCLEVSPANRRALAPSALARPERRSAWPHADFGATGFIPSPTHP